MLLKIALTVGLVFGLALQSAAQDNPTAKPMELEVLTASIGIWDAEITVWPQGPDSSSMAFKGVETNRPYGEYWIVSDFDSWFMADTIKVHSIVGYDLGQKKLYGTVVDHGPYPASLTGEYDRASKTVTWMTEARDVDGTPMVQKTTVTHKSADERVLVLSVPAEQKDEFTKFMQITFIKRQ